MAAPRLSLAAFLSTMSFLITHLPVPFSKALFAPLHVMIEDEKSDDISLLVTFMLLKTICTLLVVFTSAPGCITTCPSDGLKAMKNILMRNSFFIFKVLSMLVAG